MALSSLKPIGDLTFRNMHTYYYTINLTTYLVPAPPFERLHIELEPKNIYLKLNLRVEHYLSKSQNLSHSKSLISYNIIVCLSW